jgi:hypothetical protein
VPDADPAQVALLRAIVSPDCDVTVVGDPDQSIYAFRGADVGGIFRFAEDFGTHQRPARTIVLRSCRRFGPALRSVADIGLRRVQYPGVIGWGDMREQHRAPQCLGERPDSIAADVLLCEDSRAEAAAVVERILRLRQQGRAWLRADGCARAQCRPDPGVRAGVRGQVMPTFIDGDESPVASNNAVSALLDALVAVEKPGAVTASTAYGLLCSPLCGIDPADLQAAIRAVRIGARTGDPTRSSAE